MISRFALLILLTLTLSTTAIAEQSLVVATVNGENITTDMMANELSTIHSAQSSEVHRSDFSLDRLLQKLINNRLLVQDAYALGIDQEQSTQDVVRWYRETSAYQMLLEDVRPKEILVPESELKAGFERYYRRVMLRLICVIDSSLSHAIVDSIGQGVSMASLARNHSIDKYKSLGGDAGLYPLYDVPEDLSMQLETASPGDVFGPMFLWNTWAVVRAEAFLNPDKLIYDSVKVILHKQLLIDKGAEIRRAFIAEEGAGTPVWVDSAAVDSIQILVALNQEPTSHTVLRVGKHREMTAADLKKKYVHRIVGRSDRDQREVLWEVVDEQYQMMMLKEIATHKEYLNDPRLDAGANAFRDSMMLVTYLQTVIAPTVKITDQEIKTYYDSNPDKFFDSGRIRVAIITRETLAEAQTDYERIVSGADFTWIAKQYSTDEYKDRGGVRDWAALSKFPRDIAAQLEAVEIGTCLPPLSGDEGFVVMKLVEREQGPKLLLAQVEGGIRSRLEAEKQLAAIEATLTELRAESEITINEAALKALQVTGPDGN